MIDLTVRTKIDKPTTAVYDFVVTHYMQNHPRWDPRVVRNGLDGGGALTLGATGTEVRKQMGREQLYKFRVAELTGDHISFDATGPNTTFGATWSVTPAGAGSELSISFQLGMSGLMGLFQPLMKGSVRKEMTQAGQNIKQMVEAA